MNKLFLTILFVTYNTFAFESDLSSFAKELNNEIKANSKLFSSLVFNEKYKTNLNSGNLQYNISLPLLKNPVIGTQINLSYNSSNGLNTGFGIGFRLDLPQIDEIINYNNKTSHQLKFKGRVFNLYKTSNSKDGCEQYRPLIQSTPFYLERCSNKWLLSQGDGKLFEFDIEGQLNNVKYLKNRIIFKWSGQYLEKITYKRDTLTIFDYKLNYYESQRSLPFYINNKEYSQNKIINSIAISYLDSNDEYIKTKNAFKFDSQNQYLNKVSYREEVLFNGGYELFKKKTDMSISLQENERIAYLSSLENYDIIDSRKYSESTKFLDLNNNFLSDQLKTDYSNILLETSLQMPKDSEDYKIVDNIWTPIKTSKELEHTINKTEIDSRLILDDSNSHIRIPFKLAKLVIEESIKKDNGQKIKSYKAELRNINYTFRDFNNDGLTDLFICKDVIADKENQIIKSIIDKVPFTGDSEKKGEIYYLSRTLNQKYSLIKANISLECNSSTIAIDVNKDGRPDLLNGKSILLNSGSQFTKYPIELDSLDIKINDKTGNHLSLVKINNQLVIEDIESTFFHVDSGVVLYKKDNNFLSKDISTHNLLLTNVSSPFGGEILFEYNFQKGHWTNNKVTFNGNSLTEYEEYRYTTPNYDLMTGAFYGFTKVEKRYHDGHNEDLKEVYTYNTTTALKNSNTSSKLIGFLKEKTKIGSNEKISRKFQWSYLNLDSHSLFPYSDTLESHYKDNKVIKELSKTLHFVFDRHNIYIRNKTTTVSTEDFTSKVKKVENYETKNNYIGVKKESYVSENGLKKNHQKYHYDTSGLLKEYEGLRTKLNFEYNQFGDLIKETNSIFEKVQVASYRPNGTTKYFRNTSGEFKTKIDLYNGKLLEVEKLNSNGKNKKTFTYHNNNTLKSFHIDGISILNNMKISNNKYIANYLNDIYEYQIDSWGRIESTKLQNSNKRLLNTITSFKGRHLQTLEGPTVISQKIHDSLGRISKETNKLTNKTNTFKYNIPMNDDFFDIEYINGIYIGSKKINLKKEIVTDSNNSEKVDFTYSSLSKINSSSNGGKWTLHDDGTFSKFSLNGSSVIEREWSKDLTSYVENDMDFQLDENSKPIYSTSVNELGESFVKNDLLYFDKEYENDQIRKNLLTIVHNDEFFEIEEKLEYDKYENIKRQVLNEDFFIDYRYNTPFTLNGVNLNNKIKYDISYKHNDEIKAIAGIHLTYSNDSELTEVNYGSFSLKFEYSNQLLSNICILSDCISYTYNKIFKIEEINKSTNTTNNNQYQYKNDAFELIDSTSKNSNNRVKRDNLGRVQNYRNYQLKWQDQLLSRIKDNSIYYDSDKSLKAVYNNEEQILYKVNQDTYLLNSKDLVHKLVVNNRIIAVIINEVIYPVLTDHLGSVIAMYDKSGTKLWEREYSLWGVKKLIYTKNNAARKLESLTIFGFAHLLEVPNIKDIYWSQTRAYLPYYKEWGSIDPTFIYSPKKLLKQKNNWNYFQYASGDPINFIDPSGFFSESYSYSTSSNEEASGQFSARDAWDFERDSGYDFNDFSLLTTDEIGNFALGWTGLGDFASAITGREISFNLTSLNPNSLKELNNNQRKEAFLNGVFDLSLFALGGIFKSTSNLIKASSSYSRAANFSIFLNSSIIQAIELNDNINDQERYRSGKIYEH